MCVLKKNVFSASVRWSVLYLSVRSSWSVMFKFSVSLLVFCLDDLSVIETGISKSPTITSPLNSRKKICLLHIFGCFDIRHLYIYNCYIFLVN